MKKDDTGSDTSEHDQKTKETPLIKMVAKNTERDIENDCSITFHDKSLIGTKLGSFYTLSDEVLGKGGFSTVVKGRDIFSSDYVAVKIIKKKLLGNEYAALLAEICILEEISHPKIVKMEDWFNECDILYVIQEKMDGGNLQQCLDEVFAFKEDEARRYIKDVAEALAYIHSKNIVHKDVKLENILLQKGRSPCAKLSDFGLAKSCLRALS